MYFSCKWSNRSQLPQTSNRIYTYNQTTKMHKNTSKFTYMQCHIEQEQRNICNVISNKNNEMKKGQI